MRKQADRLLLVVGAVVVLALRFIASATTQLQRPIFEVASVKLTAKCGRTSGDPGLLIICGSLNALIKTAYISFADGERHPSWDLIPVEGGPAWVQSDLYQINARATADSKVPFPLMAGPMLQALLENRFELKIHRETRQVPVYELTVAKGGLKLSPSKEDSCVAVDFINNGSTPKPLLPNGKPCATPMQVFEDGVVTRELRSVTMDQFSAYLGSAFSPYFGAALDRPVINKTGIPGRFDFYLKYSETKPGGSSTDPNAIDSSNASIFTALQEQLGLRLTAARGPGQFLVIDHAERPGENGIVHN